MRLSSISAIFSFAAIVAVFAGCSNGPQGAQTVLPGARIAPDTSGGRARYDLLQRLSVTETVIFGFPDQYADGYAPEAALLDVNGTFYGTTYLGGLYNAGTVFKITPSGTETVLHFFHGGADGGYPQTSLINLNGTLYGTTSSGGLGASGGYGTVFRISTSGNLTILHRFAGPPTDGKIPAGALSAFNGKLYGMTGEGGQYGYGTVFDVTTTGVESVVYSFRGRSDGGGPGGNLINVKGTLYGTTAGGGSSNHGTVFSVTAAGVEKVLHSFSGSPDGSEPVAGLANVNGTLYGTTVGGGLNKCDYYGIHGCGTVFSMRTSGQGRILYRFTGPPDAANPEENLLNVNGTLYSTTAKGGNHCAYWITCGTVYSVTTSGQEKVIYRFKGGLYGHSDGSFPLSALIDVHGELYGTTAGGGPYGCNTGSGGCGTVFKVTLGPHSR